MRHGVAGYKLGRTSSQRKLLRMTQISQLFEHERIITTQAKALSMRNDAEKLITLAKKGNQGDKIQKMNAARLASSRLGNDRELTKKLFDDIAPRYDKRNGGYTRMIKLGPAKMRPLAGSRPSRLASRHVTDPRPRRRHEA